MGTFFVVAGHPLVGEIADFFERSEEVRFEDFRPVIALAAFDLPVLHGPPGLNDVKLDAPHFGLAEENPLKGKESSEKGAPLEDEKYPLAAAALSPFEMSCCLEDNGILPFGVNDAYLSLKTLASHVTSRFGIANNTGRVAHGIS